MSWGEAADLRAKLEAAEQTVARMERAVHAYDAHLKHCMKVRSKMVEALETALHMCRELDERQPRPLDVIADALTLCRIRP